SAHPIQPLSLESAQATPLTVSCKSGEMEPCRKPVFSAKQPGGTLGRWIRSPPKPWRSDLGNQHDHDLVAAGQAQARLVSFVVCYTWMKARTLHLPGRPHSANSSAVEPHHSRGTVPAQEDGPGQNSGRGCHPRCQVAGSDSREWWYL